MVHRGSGPLYDSHLLAGINQPRHQMAADEPRAAGHNRQVVHGI